MRGSLLGRGSCNEGHAPSGGVVVQGMILLQGKGLLSTVPAAQHNLVSPRPFSRSNSVGGVDLLLDSSACSFARARPRPRSNLISRPRPHSHCIVLLCKRKALSPLPSPQHAGP